MHLLLANACVSSFDIYATVKKFYNGKQRSGKTALAMHEVIMSISSSSAMVSVYSAKIIRDG